MNRYLKVEISVTIHTIHTIQRSQRGGGQAPDARDTGDTGVTLQTRTNHMRDHMGMNPCDGQMNCRVVFPFLIKQRRTSAPVSYRRLMGVVGYMDGWPIWHRPDRLNW